MPEPVVEDGLMVELRPKPKTAAVRVTGLLKPFRELSVTVE